MNDVIDALFDGYDRGEVSRAELVRTILANKTVGVAAPQEKHPGVLVGVNLHHVNILVSDLNQTEAFYRKLFSLAPKRPVPNRPYILDLGDGVSFLSIPERANNAGTIDHFCVGVRDFDAVKVAETLAANGFTDGLVAGDDFVYVTDPDGVRVQISSPVWRG